MRIFRNRGDICFSKSNKEKSNEQKFLIFALVFIVIFTIIFLSAVAVKNNFSAKEFFKPDDYQATEIVREENELPSVSGKSNFITLVTDDDNLLFVTLLQIDMDNVSYKVSCLKASTLCEGKGLDEIFRNGGAENVENAVEILLDIVLDYHICLDRSDFVELFNELGSVTYPVLSDIKFKDNESKSSYSLKIKAGEQRLDGSQVVNLTRYYLDNQNNTAIANELALACLSQQINSKNNKNSEHLFSLFMKISDTDITIRDFSLAEDKLIVLSDDMTGVKVYSAPAEYDTNNINNDSRQKIKGYFVK